MKHTLYIIICFAAFILGNESKAQVPAWGLAARPKPVNQKHQSSEKSIDLFQSAPTAPKHEVRAVWVTTLNGLDWPKTKATSEEGIKKQKEELCQLLDQLRACRINTVVLQTRIRGSVIYPSDIEPWDICLTGEFDCDPGYDPLDFAIEETHRRGMELHAWVVTVPAFKVVNAKKMGKRSLFKTHPELLRKHGEQYYLDPGLPGSADYLTAICEEITSNYDIDGIHFDYIRYPEQAASFSDAISFRKFGHGKEKRAWRRSNVTRMVRQAYEAVKELKPWVRVSCSPVGKYNDLSRYSARGWSALGAVYQDAQGWLRDGIMDMLLPMMYFQGDHFYPFAADWQENSYGRTIAPGLGIYFLSPKEKDWELGVIQRELCYVRHLGLSGQAFFRSRFLTDNTKDIYDYLQKDFYPYPALLPPMTWQSSERPDTPTLVTRERRNGVNEYIEWAPQENCRYVIYASSKQPVDTDNPQNIVKVTYDNNYTYSLLGAYYYDYHIVVTALDRYGNESLPLEL